jgi:exopolysaccharide biosynthesis polyprenyl glycosylphosphotransferase
MYTQKTKEYILLGIGDILIFFGALWCALFLRFLEVPSLALYTTHMVPFMVLGVLWAAIFVGTGLYERGLYTTSRRFLSRLGWGLGIGAGVSVLLFYTVPFFEITPKIVLGLFVVCLGALMWGVRALFFGRVRRKERALCIGSGEEMKEIQKYVEGDPSASFVISKTVSLDDGVAIPHGEALRALVRDCDASLIIIDTHHPQGERIMQYVYPLLFTGVRVKDQSEVYEECFERIPISVISHRWIMERITAKDTYGYAVFKRAMDVCAGVVLGIATLIVYPFVMLAITLEDGGPAFFSAERIGRGGKVFRMHKFRSMSVAMKGSGIEEKPEITRVGAFLRKSRIDELPQLWNVIRGDISLIGPRPEYPGLVETYAHEVPFYQSRHVVRPGLSGWAQLYHENHPHHGADIEETRNKLSYDLYYITHRSLLLDIDIALKTVRVLLGRKGR